MKRYGKYGRKASPIVKRYKENMEKPKLNRDKTWTIWKKGKFNSEKIRKIWKKPKLNSETIWKIQKKIVKRYEKYGRKIS